MVKAKGNTPWFTYHLLNMDLVPSLFHEKQEGLLCAQHALNNLLQGHYYTSVDLSELAAQLDQEEITVDPC